MHTSTALLTGLAHVIAADTHILILGSLDSAIRNAAADDFKRLHRLCPEWETVGFNGQALGKFAPQFAAHGYRTVVLPSSSPTHMALSVEQKLAVWRQLISNADVPDGAPKQGSLL